MNLSGLTREHWALMVGCQPQRDPWSLMRKKSFAPERLSANSSLSIWILHCETHQHRHLIVWLGFLEENWPARRGRMGNFGGRDARLES